MVQTGGMLAPGAAHPLSQVMLLYFLGRLPGSSGEGPWEGAQGREEGDLGPGSYFSW